MNKIPSALNLGIRRGGLEIRQFARQRESVVFTHSVEALIRSLLNTSTVVQTYSLFWHVMQIKRLATNSGFQEPIANL